ncbi:hypothetical protein FA15DRAFT_748753 [Coprinopsis marcescibilis]|uniref:Uncharacterized protein n=1 Tax=Coprinopsis marcescibilis TaxID=230819 RepID=A0A5C3KPJ4_COPMA|nr:hypothetical protein FA15DRAFT_748753 [Coprinopsis marcescibilis]
MAYPKVVALDTDWTIFWGWLNKNTWGKGAGAFNPVQDNINQVNYWEIQDRTNANNKCGMYADIPRIVEDILKNGAKIAVVSRNTSKDMCDRALWYWKVKDDHGKEKRLIELVKFDEVYDSEKTVHFEKIKGYTGHHYTEMIHYDDEAPNNIVEMMLGVTFQVSRDQKGLTWENYQEGLDMWRRNKAIESPWHGLDLNLYPKKKLIGYSGMDLETIKLLEAGGRRHDRIEAARWGYAMYVADDPAVAKYFANWIKQTAFGPQAQTIVCAIYARDDSIFNSLPKIWVPDQNDMKTNVSSPNKFQVAWSQEDRDRKVASWGVKKPYILFSRHPNMGRGFPVPNNWRFNEMVVYGQVQEALMLTVRLSDQELNHHVQNGPHLHYEQKFSEWNITVPNEARADFRRWNENF